MTGPGRVLVFVVLTAGALLVLWLTEPPPPSAAGRKAPEISGTDVEGRSFRLSDYRGQVVLLDFWRDQCPPCRIMHSIERSLVDRYQGKPFVIVGVNTNSRREVCRQAQEKEGLTWRSWWDGRDEISRNWGVEYTPTVYVIDAQGAIRYESTGLPQEQELTSVIDKLLAKGGS